MHSPEQFQLLIKTDAWTIPQLADCLKQALAGETLNDEMVCSNLLAWLDATPHVADHATGRRFTRLQFIENTLSAAGFALTLRDFDGWFVAQSLGNKGDWRPNELLPYTPVDPRLAEQEAHIDQLEHDLHQMEVARNRVKSELVHVQAERDHYIAVHSEEIYKSVSANYQNSASWRVTKPLRRLMAWRRGESLQATTAEATAPVTMTIPPWKQAGYSVEKAWKAPEVEDFDRSDYAEWVRRYDDPGAAEIVSLTEQANALSLQPNAPKFSILMAVEQPNLAWFKEAVTSVQAQIYPNWELCLAISTITDAATCTACEDLAITDQRIKLVHAVTATESLLTKALELASGDWICKLNAINKIAFQAINTPARVIISYKNTKIIYSDHDKLAAPHFQRNQPYFKPDWNLDLFYAQNYIHHLCFFKADLVQELGGFDAKLSSLESVASFDLILRALEHIESSQIHHIPQVLVHVREDGDQADIDKTQQIQSLNAHFQRTGQSAQVLAVDAGLQIQYALPIAPPSPLASLIIPTKNNLNLLRQCIDSILGKTSYPNFEILVIDNGSDQSETLDYLKSLMALPRIRVIRDNYAFNYSALNNYAVTFAKGEVIGLINDDIEVTSADWLSDMVSHALRPGVGAVGARLWYPNHTLQHAGMVLVGGVARHVHKHLAQGQPGFNGRAVLTQNFTAVTGACLVVKKALFEQVGGLNDQELAVGFNDVDFCLKLVEAGYRNVWTPYAELIHHESATRGQDNSPEKQRRAEKELRFMRKRWGDQLHLDPAYSPNLSDGHDDMSFAWPPRRQQ
jgi:O-antigen biosynthesis protein